MSIKKPLFTFLFSILFLVNWTFAYQEMIIKNIKSEGIGTKPVRVIKVVLDGEDFVVNSLASTGGDSLENLMHQVGGTSAINGIFFCPASYSYCHGETFSNFERIFNGEVDEQSKFWPDTWVRGIFGFEKNGTPLFVQNNLSEMEGIWTDVNKEKINDIHFGLGNFPILALWGENMVQYSKEYLDHKLTGRVNRNFICNSKDKKTIYMGVIGGVNLYELSDFIINEFWCSEALNLDAGESANMIYKDNILEQRERKIMDAWVVVNREQYKKLTQLREKDIIKSEPYIPDDYYSLSEKEEKQIKVFKQVFSDIIKEKWDEGEELRRKVLKAVRKIISLPSTENNPKKKRMFNALLIAIFSSGY